MSGPLNNLNKKYPECANEALNVIRTNYRRVSRQELIHLSYEFIFLYEKQANNLWNKVSKIKIFIPF
jgi:hypothetical protein